MLMAFCFNILSFQASESKWHIYFIFLLDFRAIKTVFFSRKCNGSGNTIQKVKSVAIVT